MVLRDLSLGAGEGFIFYFLRYEVWHVCLLMRVIHCRGKSGIAGEGGLLEHVLIGERAWGPVPKWRHWLSAESEVKGECVMKKKMWNSNWKFMGEWPRECWVLLMANLKFVTIAVLWAWFNVFTQLPQLLGCRPEVGGKLDLATAGLSAGWCDGESEGNGRWACKVAIITVGHEVWVG